MSVERFTVRYPGASTLALIDLKHDAESLRLERVAQILRRLGACAHSERVYVFPAATFNAEILQSELEGLLSEGDAVLVLHDVEIDKHNVTFCVSSQAAHIRLVESPRTRK